jgi:hypothetical protein
MFLVQGLRESGGGEATRRKGMEDLQGQLLRECQNYLRDVMRDRSGGEITVKFSIFMYVRGNLQVRVVVSPIEDHWKHVDLGYIPLLASFREIAFKDKQWLMLDQTVTFPKEYNQKKRVADCFYRMFHKIYVRYDQNANLGMDPVQNMIDHYEGKYK